MSDATPRSWVEALSIETQQTPDRERVTQAVQHRCGDSGGRREPELEHQTMERHADAARMHGSLAVEGEQRCVVVQQHTVTSALQLLADEFADARAVRDKPTLAELAALDDEQAASAVDVTDTQGARLTDAQSKPVAEREDRAIGRSALGGLRVIRERGGCIEQPAGLGDVEQERDPRRRFPTRASLQRRGIQQLMCDGPVEQAAHDAQQMIETTRARA